jgi:hypothetical protein
MSTPFPVFVATCARNPDAQRGGGWRPPANITARLKAK